MYLGAVSGISKNFIPIIAPKLLPEIFTVPSTVKGCGRKKYENECHVVCVILTLLALVLNV